MVTGSTAISGLPTGTIDNMQAVFPLSIGMPSSPQTIQASLQQAADMFTTQYPSSGTVIPNNGWVALPPVTRQTAVSGTVSGNETGTVSSGAKLWWQQYGNNKYGIIGASSYSAGSNMTNFGILTNSDHNFITGSVSSPMYSRIQKPAGFPGSFNWTPTFFNLVVGNGTLSAKMMSQDRWVDYSISVVFGGTTQITGSVSHVLPALADFSSATFIAIGNAVMHDFANAIYYGASVIQSSLISVRVVNVAGTYAVWGTISATVPFTWATGDELTLNGRFLMTG